jgi:phospholipase/carboxylesterase
MKSLIPTDATLTRRGALRSLVTGIAGTLVAPLASACGNARARSDLDDESGLGRLGARRTASNEAWTPGLHPLDVGVRRDGALYLPPGYRPDRAVPLVLLLHGAGGSGAAIVRRFRPYADELDIAFVAPDSRGPTWNSVGRFGADVAFVDKALRTAFLRCNTAPDRLYIAGFSDGASYSLSLGLTNGDLFPRIAAFSPGYMDPAEPHAKPEIFIAHGTRDDILPIDASSRRLVPQLRRDGYVVEYREFDGVHETPAEICRAAFQWLVRT